MGLGSVSQSVHVDDDEVFMHAGRLRPKAEGGCLRAPMDN